MIPQLNPRIFVLHPVHFKRELVDYSCFVEDLAVPSAVVVHDFKFVFVMEGPLYQKVRPIVVGLIHNGSLHVSMAA